MAVEENGGPVNGIKREPSDIELVTPPRGRAAPKSSMSIFSLVAR
jgi:hypothetical protein